jgi:hypothetical protein
MQDQGSSAEYFIYMDPEEQKQREIVIYHDFYNCSWPTNKMIFFKSSGTSNISSAWLSNTYFPTTGLSCHGETDEIPFFNEYNDHAGIETLRHVHGHIVKMSDYNNFLKIKTRQKMSTPYYEFKQLSPFYKNLLDTLNTFFTDDFIRNNKELIIARKSKYNFKYFADLIKSIQDYFSCEEQIKISYSLSDNNQGLWSWEFCDITFVDICKQIWGGTLPSKINKIKTTDITNEYLNTDETNEYLLSKNANVSFKDFLNFIDEENLFKKYINFSEFMNEKGESNTLNATVLIINKAERFKKQEEKKLESQQIASVALPPPPLPVSVQVPLPVPPPPPLFSGPIDSFQQIQEDFIRPTKINRQSVKKNETETRKTRQLNKLKQSDIAREDTIAMRRTRRNGIGGKKLNRINKSKKKRKYSKRKRHYKTKSRRRK